MQIFLIWQIRNGCNVSLRLKPFWFSKCSMTWSIWGNILNTEKSYFSSTSQEQVISMKTTQTSHDNVHVTKFIYRLTITTVASIPVHILHHSPIRPNFIFYFSYSQGVCLTEKVVHLPLRENPEVFQMPVSELSEVFRTVMGWLWLLEQGSQNLVNQNKKNWFIIHKKQQQQMTEII